MRLSTKFLVLTLLCLWLNKAYLNGQTYERTEASQPSPTPVDGVYEPSIVKEKKVLTFAPIREADVFWEKKIWRVIDVREKMNQAFMYPENPFINIIVEGVKAGNITLYDVLDDKFSYPLTKEESMSKIISYDTIPVWDPEDFTETIKVVPNVLNWEDIKRFRVKEVWFFDENTSTMRVRILGIAPLREKYNEQGDFMYEQPLFWAYYPDLRHELARHTAFNRFSDTQTMTWEDIFEMRYFASYIYKQSNILDYRLKNMYTGVDLLLEADKIKNEIFNFENDLWSN